MCYFCLNIRFLGKLKVTTTVRWNVCVQMATLGSSLYTSQVSLITSLFPTPFSSSLPCYFSRALHSSREIFFRGHTSADKSSSDKKKPEKSLREFLYGRVNAWALWDLRRFERWYSRITGNLARYQNPGEAIIGGIQQKITIEKQTSVGYFPRERILVCCKNNFSCFENILSSV